MTDHLFAASQSVSDEQSFLAFARALKADRESSDGASLTPDGFQGEWANNSISDFIESAVAWAEDSDFGSRPGPKPANTWTLFAAFLWAGRGYE